MRSLLLLFAVAGCQAEWRAETREVRALYGARRFADAARAARADAEPNDRIAALLVEGAALHDAGRFADSNRALLAAEDAMARAWRESPGDEVLRALASGAAGRYVGEDYERIWANVYAILNYLALGQREDALVEVRRLSGRLGVLADVRGHGRRYRDDPFAQWLSGMLYQEDGDTDDAEIARLDVKRLGSTPFDPLLDFSLPDQEGEIVLIHFNGLIPERIETRFNDVALPALKTFQSPIQKITIKTDQKTAETTVVEDLQQVALATFADRRGEILRQAIARAAARAAAHAAADEIARQNGWAGLIAQLAAAAADAAEGADLRCWANLPATVGVARLRLPPGRHAVTLDLVDGAGRLVRREQRTVEVAAGARTWLGLRTVD